jgi:hypothetical protein
MRLTCILHFQKPTEQERENINQFKNGLHIVADANNIDLKVEENREWSKGTTYSSWEDIILIILIMLGAMPIIAFLTNIILTSIK